MTWYILEDEQVRQMSDEAFHLQASSGGILPQSKIWTEGMPEWVPASRFLETAIAKPKLSRPYILLFLIISIACLTIFFTKSRDFLLDDLTERIGLGPGVVAVATMATLMTAAGAFITFRMWSRPDRRSASKFAGFVFLLGSTAAFLEAVLLASFLIQAPDIYRILLAAQNFDDASVVRSGDAAIISGTLGPHLMRDFENIAAAGPVRAVQISSSGGLIASALELAGYLEEHRTLTIIVNQCASACILLAVASPQSYAEANVSFGFHHTFPAAPAQSQIVRVSFEKTWEIYRDYLIRHGVPEAILIEAAKHGADSVYSVSASDMAHYGAIKGVLAGGKIVATGNKM